MVFPRHSFSLAACVLGLLLAQAAPAAEAAALTPAVQGRLDLLKAGYEAFVLKRVKAPFEEGVKGLNAQVRPALERAGSAAAQRKDLDGLVRIKADLERIDQGQVLTATDAPPPEVLKSLYATYRLEMEKVMIAWRTSLADAQQRYDKGLALVQDELTTQQEVAAALRVKELREALAQAQPDAPGTPAAAAAAKPDPAAAAAGTRQAEEAVKKLGGTFTQSSDGAGVSLVRTKLTTAELLQIGADKRLKSFYWNTGGGLDDAGMAAFAGMKNLGELMLWSVGSITDAGLANLKDCEQLISLNIGSNSGGFTGAGLEYLSGCKSLRSLTLNYLSKIEGPNLRHLSGLEALETLLLSSCKGVTDADLEWIAKLKSLKVLHLGNTSVTDAGMAGLMALKNLKELYVSAPGVTPAGTAALAKELPELKINFVK